MLRSIAVPIVAVNARGHVVFWNTAATALYGWSANEMLGQPLSRLHTRFRDDSRESSLAALGKGGVWEGEVLQRHKAGFDVPVWSHVTKLEGEAASLVAVNRPLPLQATSGRTPTPAERAQEFLEATPDSVVVVDAAGKIVFVNRRLQECFGYERDELIGATVETLLPLRHRAQHEKHRQAFSSNKQVRSMGLGLVLSARRKNGEEFPVDVSLSPIESSQGSFVLATVRDVTERRLIEQTLDLIRNVTTAANESPSIEFALRSAMELVCELSGATFARVYRHDQVRGRLVLYPLLKDDPDAPQMSEQWKVEPEPGSLTYWAFESKKAVLRSATEEPEPHRSLLADAGMTVGFAFPVVSGTDVPFVLKFWCRRTPAVMNTLLATFHQIGVQLGRVVEREKATAQTLRATNLQRSNEELALFAHVASHDLQEPLRMITAFLDLLSRKYGPQLNEEAQRYIEFAVSGAHRLRGLIRSVLEYSQVDRGSLQRTSIELDGVIQQVLANLRQSIADNGATIVCDKLPRLKADESQMMQLFQNIISNALRFRRADTAPLVHVSAQEQADTWRVLVADNGIGISEGNAQRVFEVFSRLHPVDKFPGSGVGLAVCQRIVKRHGGRIWFESQVDQGTTFFVELPKG
ncbi:MAG: PAS domain S-box protein [Deltaproteobacteria bacterium]|nr:PAS domain S-box protein [Deltaproteobacteria bacterium]